MVYPGKWGGELWDFENDIVTEEITLYARWIEGTAGLAYTAVDGGYSVSMKSSIAPEIVIPSTYNEKSVVAIGDNGFYGKRNITSILIPNSVTSIGITRAYR